MAKNTSTSSYGAGGRTTGGQLDGALARLDKYIEERMALLLFKRHARRCRGNGLKLLIGSGNRLALERLVGPSAMVASCMPSGEERRQAV